MPPLQDVCAIADCTNDHTKKPTVTDVAVGFFMSTGSIDRIG